MGIPAEDFSGSSRGTRAMPNDKIARANLISDIFASRFVWAPERRFAEELIEQAASFPNGDADDLVDSTVQAMIRFRAGGFIRTANDEVEDDEPRTYRRKRMY
jgi:phage terminase large subunit-like protein